LKAILGTKFEHNDFTGFEVQPSVRGEYSLRTNQTIWASVSRAVRTPSEAENDILINPGGIPPGAATIHANPNMLAEAMIAYEIGYRFQPISRVNVDVTGFYNDYTRLRSLQPFAPPFQQIVGNALTGESYGGELAVTVEAIPNTWRLRSGYSLLKVQIHRDNGGDPTTELMIEGSSPENQLFIHSSVDLPFNLQFDTTLRYVDRLAGPGIPSYVEVDARLAWEARKDLEVAVVGQNLMHEHHPEFAPTFIGSEKTDVERGVYAKLTFRY
jgi:iron complex outermembrane recepter protein